MDADIGWIVAARLTTNDIDGPQQVGPLLDRCCHSFRQVPRRTVPDIGDTFDTVHGGQQRRLFDAHRDGYGFQPTVVFDEAGCMIAALLRPASRPSGKQIVRWLHRLINQVRGSWPRVAIMLRADSHSYMPVVMRFCRARGLDYTLVVAPTSTLRERILSLEESTTARAAAVTHDTKLRRFTEFHDAAASWDRVGRIVARVQAGPVHQDIHCARSQAENHVEAWKTHLAADRTSCCQAGANRMRLFLHIGAYWMMWSLRTPMPHRSRWRATQFDTVRLHLIKLAVRIEVMKTKVRLHLPRATPDQALLAFSVSAHTLPQPPSHERIAPNLAPR